MVTSLLVGLGVGFVLAIAPGPIAIACSRRVLAGQERESVQLALSAAAMDSVYALLAALASSALVVSLRGVVTDHAWVLLAFQVVCIMVLVGLGLHYVRATPRGTIASARPEAAREEQARLRGAASPYLLGVLIALTNLANPTFLPAVLLVTSLVQARGWVSPHAGAHVLYAVGFGTGSALWFVLLIRTVSTCRAKLPPQVIPLLSRVAGWAFLLCAGMLTYHVVTVTTGARLSGG